MEYKIEKLSEINAIQIKIEGTLTQENRKTIHSQAITALSLYGYEKLIIDVSNSVLSEDHTTGDSLDMIRYMEKFGNSGNLRIAFLSVSNEKPRKTFVNTAQLISNMDIRYFNSKDDAINWLCSN